VMPVVVPRSGLSRGIEGVGAALFEPLVHVVAPN
jgi:hypothetical protein